MPISHFFPGGTRIIEKEILGFRALRYKTIGEFAKPPSPFACCEAAMARWDLANACSDARIIVRGPSYCDNIKKVASIRELAHLEVPECHRRHIEQTGSRSHASRHQHGCAACRFHRPRSRRPNDEATAMDRQGPARRLTQRF